MTKSDIPTPGILITRVAPTTKVNSEVYSVNLETLSGTYPTSERGSGPSRQTKRMFVRSEDDVKILVATFHAFMIFQGLNPNRLASAMTADISDFVALAGLKDYHKSASFLADEYIGVISDKNSVYARLYKISVSWFNEYGIEFVCTFYRHDTKRFTEDITF